MNVGELCIREVVIARKEDSILEAARLMRQYHVGDVVVVEEKNNERFPVGILTDRDIVIEIIAEDVNTGYVSVGDAMSYDLVTAREDEDLFELIKRIQVKGIRRVPVVNVHGGLEGILSIDDIIELFTEQMVDFIKLFSRARELESKKRK